ncbi:MAG: diguanylate cyclase [Clostridiales bacterium]|nr:diguanylate cyclase [Clostridiales bacterium]
MERENQKHRQVSSCGIRRLAESRFGRKIHIFFIIIICFVISYFYIASHIKTRDIYENEIRSQIIELKKSFLKNTVDNMILRIETGRETTTAFYRQSVDSRYAVLEAAKELSSNDFVATLFAELNLNTEPEKSKWTVLIWDDDGNVLYSPKAYEGQDVNTSIEKLRPLMACYRTVEHGSIHCFYGYTKEHVENTVKMSISESIRSLRFDKGSYIWINEILNYDGGENYAIRRVHPNLPETEGEYLSTDTTDIKGNRPYLTELEGIKKDGELFFSYYFKELDSDEVSLKLSYAKLYKEYDWVIAMGVQNNEVEEQILTINKTMSAMSFSGMVLFLAVLIALVILFMSIMLLNENLRFSHRKKQMQLEISYDSLTNAKSRRFGIGYLEKVFDEYKTGGCKNPVFLMVFDVDNFKIINDRYGHSEGDRVLREIVRIIHQSIRRSDELFRLGGDEFAGVFHGMSEENAVSFAAKIVDAISAMDYKVGENPIPLSISIGISQFRESDGDYTAALKRADEAMYESKSKNGNKATLL